MHVEMSETTNSRNRLHFYNPLFILHCTSSTQHLDGPSDVEFPLLQNKHISSPSIRPAQPPAIQSRHVIMYLICMKWCVELYTFSDPALGRSELPYRPE